MLRCCYGQVMEWDKEKNIVLTKPLSLDGESDVDYKAPNLIQRILSLFKNVPSGSDLTRMQASIALFFWRKCNYFQDWTISFQIKIKKEFFWNFLNLDLPFLKSYDIIY